MDHWCNAIAQTVSEHLITIHNTYKTNALLDPSKFTCIRISTCDTLTVQCKCRFGKGKRLAISVADQSLYRGLKGHFQLDLCLWAGFHFRMSVYFAAPTWHEVLSVYKPLRHPIPPPCHTASTGYWAHTCAHGHCAPDGALRTIRNWPLARHEQPAWFRNLNRTGHCCLQRHWC